MGKRKRTIIIAILCTAAAALAVSAVYLFALPSFALVSDSAWDNCFSTAQLLKLRASYALKGYRLKIVHLGTEDLFVPDSYRKALSRLKDDYVVLGPVASSYANQNLINVSAMLSESVVLGIGTEGSALFDGLLVSDELSGWLEACEAIAGETSASSRNVALVYESDVIDYAQDLVSLFPSGGVSGFDRSKSGNVFYSSTLKEMDRLGIVIALCPYVSNMGNFFTSPNTVSWVVDYRFRAAVPAKEFFGTVGPDLEGLLAIAKSVPKESHATRTLEYVYEKATGIL